jgi:flagellin
MKIGDFSINAANISIQAEKSESNVSKALDRLAAQRALSSTDGSSMMIADSLRMQASTLSQGIRNTNEAIGMMQIADGTLSNVNKDATRLNDLSVRMNNASLNSDQKAMLQSEANALQRSMNQSINNATYNGKNVFGGNLEFSTGDSTVRASVNAPSTGSLDITNQQSILDFMKNVDSVRSDIGSAVNEMVSISNANATAVVNLKASESGLQNNDVAANYNELEKGKLQLNTQLFANSMNTDYLKEKISSLLD